MKRKRSLPGLVLAVLLLAPLTTACPSKKSAEGPPPEPSPAPSTDVSPTPPEGAGPAPAGIEDGVLFVFAGRDAHAMAGLGHELEAKRPRLSPDLLKKELVFLRKDPGDQKEIREMRALLFRTTAVLVGRPAAPLLSDCVATLKELVQLCGGALQEIEASK